MPCAFIGSTAKKADCADEAAKEDRAKAADAGTGSHSAGPVLEHGLCQRPAGGRPLNPNSDGGGSIQAGVCRSKGRPVHERRKSSRSSAAAPPSPNQLVFPKASPVTM